MNKRNNQFILFKLFSWGFFLSKLVLALSLLSALACLIWNAIPSEIPFILLAVSLAIIVIKVTIRFYGYYLYYKQVSGKTMKSFQMVTFMLAAVWFVFYVLISKRFVLAIAYLSALACLTWLAIPKAIPFILFAVWLISAIASYFKSINAVKAVE